MNIHGSSSTLGGLTFKEMRVRRLRALATEAANLAGTATKVAQAATEAAEEGGDLGIQPQVAFMTGSLTRVVKDWGAVEFLQQMRRR